MNKKGSEITHAECSQSSRRNREVIFYPPTVGHILEKNKKKERKKASDIAAPTK